MESRVLSDEQISKIHSASLRILEDIGVEVPHDIILQRFKDAGAKVDSGKKRVFIPESLINWSLEKTGKSYTLYGRDLSKKAEFGKGKRNYNSISGEALWLDEIGGKRRYPTMQDVVRAAKTADALESITIPGAMADPSDIPVNWRCVAVAAEMLKNTSKPVTLWFHDRASAKYLVDLAIALRGRREDAEKYPPFYPFFEPISPLRFPFDGIDLLFETAKINLPVPIGPMAQMGLSAPATIAGTIAQENAEILAGICITQLVREGMPVCYGGICHAFDMATTQMIFCGPEQAIFGVAMTQMGKHYGLPVYVNVGLSDSKRPDAQAGIEIATTLTLAASAGADIFGHMGICGVDQAASLDMLVLQNEIISYVESVSRNLEVDDDTLGINTIMDVVNGGDSFIEQMHTFEHFRKELWFPKLLDRNYYQQWMDAGAKSLEDSCKIKKETILKSYSPSEIDEDTAKKLDEVVSAAQRDLV